MSCGFGGPSCSGSPARTRSPGCTVDVLALGDQVLARGRARRHLGRDHDHLALALGVLAERDLAVDLADDGVILRLAGLEELGDAGQTAGDVLHLRGLARDLGDDLAGFDAVAVLATMFAPTGRR